MTLRRTKSRSPRLVAELHATVGADDTAGTPAALRGAEHSHHARNFMIVALIVSQRQQIQDS